MSYEEAEVRESSLTGETVEISIDKEKTASAENSSESQKPDSSETKPEESSDFSDVEAEDSENTEADSNEENTDENPSSPTAQAVENSIDKPILKPETELESAEINRPPPLFDSVRIMAQPASKKSENSLMEMPKI